MHPSMSASVKLHAVSAYPRCRVADQSSENELITELYSRGHLDAEKSMSMANSYNVRRSVRLQLRISTRREVCHPKVL